MGLGRGRAASSASESPPSTRPPARGADLPMAGHLASDLAFSPPPGGGGDGPGGPEPGWVDPRTWLGFQGPPGGPAVGPGLAPGTEVWGIAPCPPPYEFCGGMAYCGPQAGVGLAPQGGLEAPQLEGEAGAGVESNSEGASPEPCAALPGALKLEQEKLEPGAEEEVSGAGARGAGGRQGRPGREEACSLLGLEPEGSCRAGWEQNSGGAAGRQGRWPRAVGSWPRMALLRAWPSCQVCPFHSLGLTGVWPPALLQPSVRPSLGFEPLLPPGASLDNLTLILPSARG